MGRHNQATVGPAVRSVADVPEGGAAGLAPGRDGRAGDDGRGRRARPTGLNRTIPPGRNEWRDHAPSIGPLGNERPPMATKRIAPKPAAPAASPLVHAAVFAAAL